MCVVVAPVLTLLDRSGRGFGCITLLVIIGPAPRPVIPRHSDQPDTCNLQTQIIPGWYTKGVEFQLLRHITYKQG